MGHKKIRVFYKLGVVIDVLFSFAFTILSTMYFNKIDRLMLETGKEWKQTVLEYGFGMEHVIAIVLIVFVIVFNVYVATKPTKTIEEHSKEIIETSLSSLTKALFISYDNIHVSSVVQICDYKHKTREIVYQYNSDPMLVKTWKMDLYFGDIGEKCVKKRDSVCKEYNKRDWTGESDTYRKIVPENLRLIFAKPFLDKKGRTIAVLEIDVFENTHANRNGGTKQGFVTDDLTVSSIKNTLKSNGVINGLGEWLKANSYFLE